MKPKISILLPAYKSGKLLDKVFIPGFTNNTSIDTELIIYDNGENENEFTKLYDCTIYTKIGNGNNIGLNQALNKCADVAQGEYFFLPHTDMYLMPNWDIALLNAVKNYPPGKQLLCSRSIEPTKGHTNYHVIKDYGKQWQNFQKQELLEDFKNYKDYTIVTGYRMPFFMHRFLWETMNGVDENLFSYATDDDLFVTAYKKANIRAFWMIYNSLVYHLQGQTNSNQQIDKNSTGPYDYLYEKWKLNKNKPLDTILQEMCPWYIGVK